jgi:hypothetical protein
MQDQLRELLGIIDDNSEHLPEGDYLNAMNLLNNLYNRRPTRAPAVTYVTVEPSSLQLNVNLLRERIQSHVNDVINEFGTMLVEQLRVPPAPPVPPAPVPVPPVPDIPDRRGLENPNIPRQGGGVPYFETRDQRAEWIIQNAKEECSICHRIIARGDSRRHQRRQICAQTRIRHGF